MEQTIYIIYSFPRKDAAGKNRNGSVLAGRGTPRHFLDDNLPC
jgi:hypothetical protein